MLGNLENWKWQQRRKEDKGGERGRKCSRERGRRRKGWWGDGKKRWKIKELVLFLLSEDKLILEEDSCVLNEKNKQKILLTEVHVLCTLHIC